jgi:hypothetical protein
MLTASPDRPVIGGLLSHPEYRWPDTLGRISYLRVHPYFLPCAVAALFALLAFAFSFVCLKEVRIILRCCRYLSSNVPPQSLPSLVAKEKETHRKAFQAEYTERSPLLIQEQESAALSAPEPTRPTIKSILVRPVFVALLNQFCLTFMDMCQFALSVLFYSTPVHLGGLGLDPSKIGTIMGVFGCCNGLIQLKFLGPTLRRFGAKKVFSVCYTGMLVTFMMYPIMTYFAKRAGGIDGFVATFMAIQLACGFLITMAYGMHSFLPFLLRTFGKPMTYSMCKRFYPGSYCGKHSRRRPDRYGQRCCADAIIWITDYLANLCFLPILNICPAQPHWRAASILGAHVPLSGWYLLHFPFTTNPHDARRKSSITAFLMIFFHYLT